MVALKPVLQAWLEEAEAQARNKGKMEVALLPSGDEKRKRTSIAAPEKRSLEAYFAVQPRPSSERIAAIAGKEILGGVLCSPTETLFRENSGHCRLIGWFVGWLVSWMD